MGPVDGVSSLVRILRGNVSRNDSSSRAAEPATQESRPSQRASLEALEKELKLKLKKIEADAGSENQKARVVIEGVLAWEFGDKVRNEPKFNLLIAKVHQHLESDNRIKAALEHFLEKLAS